MKLTDPAVSVILIFLNAEKYIQEAIESVLAQTLEDWELLLVDDGSDDESSALAQEYVQQDANEILYLCHDGHRNLGMSASRNLGIRRARGGYIAFLDADDVWLPHKLEQQVAILDSHPGAALVYGKDEYWYTWEKTQAGNPPDYIPELGVDTGTLITPPSLLPLFLLGEAAIPCPTNILVRRSALEGVGGFEDSFRGAYEDQALYAKLLLRYSVIAVDECWTRYRQHPESNCAAGLRTGAERLSRANFLNWLETYLLEQGIEAGEVEAAVRKSQRRLRYPTLTHILRKAMRLFKYIGSVGSSSKAQESHRSDNSVRRS